MSRSDEHSCLSVFIAFIAGAVLLALIFLPDMIAGVGIYGPVQYRTGTVKKLYIDNSGDSSHYMVVTDAGIFEVDNGLFLGIYNSDEIYSSLEVGNTYQFKTEGNQTNSFWVGENYPYVLSVTPASP